MDGRIGQLGLMRELFCCTQEADQENDKARVARGTEKARLRKRRKKGKRKEKPSLTEGLWEAVRRNRLCLLRCPTATYANASENGPEKLLPQKGETMQGARAIKSQRPNYVRGGDGARGPSISTKGDLNIRSSSRGSILEEMIGF